ncbi:unnamed protein product [Rodentolepis nana]|uniref:Uncharacterized protein n=1 Tax=Rodentolepis nana TaxID=102285 RepID=A0A0R3TVW9_RODNA|nr:unnamed protein product [Rodentolepis nana]
MTPQISVFLQLPISQTPNMKTTVQHQLDTFCEVCYLTVSSRVSLLSEFCEFGV